MNQTLLSSAIAMGFMVLATSAAAECLDPPGDLDASGAASVADAQCSIIMVLWSQAGGVGDVPGCIQGDPERADANCDGDTTVADAQITISLVLEVPLDTDVDSDGNGCPNACEPDPCLSLDCDDGNPCTDDSCDAVAGCVNSGVQQFGQPCDDEDACTVPDLCDFEGNCTPGFVVNCDDADPCTDDLCDPAIGCVHESVDCGDGAVCVAGLCPD